MSRHEKILAGMLRSRAGWKVGDFETLYRGFGFDDKGGKKHAKFQHPRFPQLWTTVKRADPLSKAYADDAVRLIAELRRLEEESE